MLTDKKWQRFESLAAHIQQTLAPNARVETNIKIRGKNSGRLRQVDIGVWIAVGQFELFVAIDCKDYKKPVDVKEVESFIGMLRDIGANKGSIVAANGFSRSAIKVAGDAEVDLYTLIDAESVEWSSKISIPVLVDDRSIRGVAYSLDLQGRHDIDSVVVPDLKIEKIDGSWSGPVKDLLNKLWNENETLHEPGVHRHLLLYEEPLNLVSETGKYIIYELRADVAVEQTLFFGSLPLVKIQGFRNEATGYVHTKGFRTDFLDHREVERYWKRISSEAELIIQPVLTLEQASYYPLEGEGEL